ncbi:hypothetical protein [Methanosphaerula subterraneus]|uniref:hypothetical protein n=1 Tax=Methanosphaerula subterraneus TaxID=3350244 RepID=UPI003F871237
MAQGKNVVAYEQVFYILAGDVTFSKRPSPSMGEDVQGFKHLGLWPFREFNLNVFMGIGGSV